jgi:hypothetical protein
MKVVTMPKKTSSAPVKKPTVKKIVKKEYPGNLVADPHDREAIESTGKVAAKIARKPRSSWSSAAGIGANPPPGETGAGSMVVRVSKAIERELSKIERIVGNPARMQPAQRIETESRARVLASLARTLKEVMRLREQERAGDDTRAADDDAVPRDLDEFRRELSRRLEGLVAVRAPLSAGRDEPG